MSDRPQRMIERKVGVRTITVVIEMHPRGPGRLVLTGYHRVSMLRAGHHHLFGVNPLHCLCQSSIYVDSMTSTSSKMSYPQVTWEARGS
jgi:hypothetical protein